MLVGSRIPIFVASIQIHYTAENKRVAFADAYAEFGPNIGSLWESYGYTKYNHTNDYHLGLALNFDNTPRISGGNPTRLRRRLTKSRSLPSREPDPVEFRERCIARTKAWYRRTRKEKVVLIFSWNEWSEQGALEPSDIHGYGFLEALQACKRNITNFVMEK